jgi:4'-phosphopantetheinyl transferase
MLQPEWNLPPAQLSVPSGEIHIWRASLNVSSSDVHDFARMLSTDELQRAKRFRFEYDQRRFTVGRGMLRTILGRYLGTEPEQLKFQYDLNGKPLIAQPANNLEFNLSHSQELMVCAVTCQQRVGIDLEHVRSIADLEGLTQRFFAPQEHLAIQRLPIEQRSPLFFQYWTCKEALLKVTGEGLADLSKIEVAIVDNRAQVLQWTGKTESVQQWLLHLFSPAPNFVATLAMRRATAPAEQKPYKISFWYWRNGE